MIGPTIIPAPHSAIACPAFSGGLILTAASLWIMTGFTPQMDARLILLSGVVQGLGLGQVFVPLSTVAFSTLPPAFRADATSLFSLVRNIGSSIGISMCIVMLTRNLQVSHADLSAFVTPYNPNLTALFAHPSAAEVARLDQLVNQQALLVSYIDDFYLLMWVTLSALPLVFMLRRPKGAVAAPPAVHAD